MNTLIKYNQKHDWFNELTRGIFNDVFNDPFFAYSRNYAVENVTENDKNYIFEIELPRFKIEDIKIEALSNAIKITAKNDKKSYIRQFECYNADAEKAESRLEDGVLTITVPKIPEVKPKYKQIEIKTNSKKLEDKKN